MSVKVLKRRSVEASKRSNANAMAAKRNAASTLQRFNASTIEITSRQRAKRINKRLLQQIVSALFDELSISKAELGINLVGAKEMARVNSQYLQHEGSTDVITFDHGDAPFVIRHSSCQLHGELFVCVEDAITQAKQFRTTWQSEVVRYIVHGVLHLLGYDDLKPIPRRKMKWQENRLVRLLEKQFTFARL
jgi:probable rRNA maturation factor